MLKLVCEKLSYEDEGMERDSLVRRFEIFLQEQKFHYRFKDKDKVILFSGGDAMFKSTLRYSIEEMGEETTNVLIPYCHGGSVYWDSPEHGMVIESFKNQGGSLNYIFHRYKDLMDKVKK